MSIARKFNIRLILSILPFLLASPAITTEWKSDWEWMEGEKSGVNFGSYPLGRTYPLAQRFEVFRTGWESHRVSAELGKVWSELPPAIPLKFQHIFVPGIDVQLNLGLRREISAWHKDPLGGNWPLSSKEVDLNQPTVGFFRAEKNWGGLTLGRFPLHWSPSDEYGLALSHSVPYHNGMTFFLRSNHIQYLFLVSSLNPWLEGSPQGDTSNTDYPFGSEAWRQRHYPDKWSENAHLRVYADPIKTLIAHRIEIAYGSWQAGITELNVIGGKTPDGLDLNPFGVYHNDFKEGFASKAISLDTKIKLPLNFTLFGELFIDDLRYSATEGEGSPSIIGLLGGLEHVWTRNPQSQLMQSFHVIQTDPLMYRYYQPYNTLSSRFILTSNNQEEGATPFVDKYVVDYPLGYTRGGDALDFRYKARVQFGPNRGVLRLEYLTHGGAVLNIPYEQLADGTANKNRYKREEWIVRFIASRVLGHGATLIAGAEEQVLLWPSRIQRDLSNHYQLNLGVSWQWP